MNAIAVMVVLVVAGIATATHAITPNNIVASNILDLLKSTFVSSSKENNMNMLNPSYLTSGENEDEIKNWSKYYQTDESASKEKNAKELLEKNIQPPNDAYKSAFNVAKIFDGDKGFTTQGLTNTLLKVGAIESMNWASNRQQTDNDKKGERTGVGRSYWSVEPSTALDLAKNSGYLGNNFNTYFKRYEKGGMSAKDTFASMTKEEIGDLLMNDQDLAAAFAAAKIVTTYPSLKKE